ncbi:MAG TPA: methylmalonyl-CoA mutase family protein, partial [Candidatus Thalassarchaeaceae archaeon]|nr:methylmalonyl-CoA mutase family protein [Candidatus Thalassarchaeaceae archaeon]
IHESAWEHLRSVEDKSELVVGVNSHVDETEPVFEGLILDSSEANSKISRLIEMKANRNIESVNESLSELRQCCRNGSNVMPPIISAVKAEATVGEVNSVLREEFGTWVAPSGV